MKKFLTISKTILKFTLFAAAFMVLAIIFYVNSSTSKYTFDKVIDVPRTKAALVLGAGIRGSRPSVYLQDRLDAAIELYRTGKAGTILISGDDGNDRDDEIRVMRKYLLEQGVPEPRITEDTSGYNTYASVYRAKNTFGFNEITIVTQNYHLPRAIFICKKMGMTCYGLSADKSKYSKMAQHKLREYFATVKSFWITILNTKPVEFKENKAAK
ncbi:SanA protein [Elusimicrobium posterum]|uniref:SanA/YdcF family protein n=1 Tax=Elusimicrobium posterum TaxID=3116653 RepID=UPI003C78A94E